MRSNIIKIALWLGQGRFQKFLYGFFSQKTLANWKNFQIGRGFDTQYPPWIRPVEQYELVVRCNHILICVMEFLL